MRPFCYIGQGQSLTFQIQKDEKQTFTSSWEKLHLSSSGQIQEGLVPLEQSIINSFHLFYYQSSYFSLSLVAPVNVVPLQPDTHLLDISANAPDMYHLLAYVTCF